MKEGEKRVIYVRSAHLDVLDDALQHDCFEEVSNVLRCDVHVSAAPCP